jgi:hypothetical protein
MDVKETTPNNWQKGEKKKKEEEEKALPTAGETKAARA